MKLLSRTLLKIASVKLAALAVLMRAGRHGNGDGAESTDPNQSARRPGREGE